MASGSTPYTDFGLSVYDFVALKIAASYLWKCPTTSVLLPFFIANAGPNHMDIGVGTGYYLKAMKEQEQLANRVWPQKLVLVDLNPKCLEKAASRLGQPERTACVQADILQPLSLPPSLSDGTLTQFDSIGLMGILHCLPPPIKNKTQVFANVKKYLSPEGTLFGITLLGKGVQHNWMGRILMWYMNKNGYFGNTDDAKEEFVEALQSEFEDVETTVEGCILLFRARKPK
ncbi:hypothetical protein VTO42DRAFT_7849 [Malbranchea cinnamomea]